MSSDALILMVNDYPKKLIINYNIPEYEEEKKERKIA